MFLIRKLTAICAIRLLVTACAMPRIDTLTDESTKTSVRRARASLPADRRAKFDELL